MAVKKQKFDIKRAQENAQKKKDRRNKIYAYILLAFFIFWTICSGLSIYNTITQHFSADNGRIVASADVVDDNDRYPSENLLSFTSFTYPGTYGLIYERNAQYGSVKFGSVDFGGDITDSDKAVAISLFSNSVTANYYYGYQLRSSDLYLPAGTYTFSKNGTTAAGYKCGIVYGQLGQNGLNGGKAVNQYSHESYTFTLTEPSYFAVVFEVNGNDYATAGQVYEVFPMLNVGDTAYPFIPNLDMVYNAGVNAGNAGILGGLVVDYMYDPANYVDGYTYALGTWVPSVFVRGGIDLTSLANQVISEVGGATGLGAEGSSFEFSFVHPIARKNFDVSFGPNDYIGSASISTVYNRSFVTWASSLALSDTREIIIDIVPDNGALTFDLSSVPDGGYISSLHLIDFDPRSFYRVMYDDNFDYNAVYQEGFENGYNEGIQNGSVTADKQYQNGYNAGYDIGYGLGEQAGIQSANDYSFFSLIAACIDVPIQAFMGLFNFEILGMNMTNFFLGLMTAGLVLCVLKFVLGGA